MSIDPVTGSGTASTSDPAIQKAASGFEELLVRQLAQVLVDSTQPEGTDDGETTGGAGTDATTSLLQSFLPDALAQSVTNAGGLGLAPSLSTALQESDR